MGIKYVVFFLVDAFHYKSLGAERRGHSPTPFLDKLFASGTQLTNVFSQAPFTEGATYGLYSGQNALDGTSYMFCLRDVPRTMGEVFRDNGYRTHTNVTSYPHLQGFMRGFDRSVFATDGAPELIWDYRLRYFAELHARGALDASDHEVITDLVTDNFVVGQAYLRAICDETPESAYVLSMVSDRERAAKTHDFLVAQEKLFRADKSGYVRQLLDQQKAHPLFAEYAVHYDPVDPAFRDYVTKKMRWFVARSFLRSSRFALRNQQSPENAVKEATRYLLGLARKGKLRRLAKELGKHVTVHPRTWFDVDLKERFRPWHGIKSGLDHVRGVLESSARTEPDQPVFVLSHVDGLHIPFRYLSTELADRDLFERELQTMERYLANVDPRSPYLMSYDYTLCYLDEKVREFVEGLQASGLWNDTAFIIGADHGNSFTGATRRKNTVNNFYDENYHIPLAITGGSIPPRRIEGLGSSVDILTTLTSLLGLKEEVVGDGMSLTKGSRDIITMEHYGSGCPDWRRRGKNIAARSESFKVMYTGEDPDRFDPRNIREIYDLAADPGETKNLLRTARDSREVAALVDVIEARHQRASAKAPRAYASVR